MARKIGNRKQRRAAVRDGYRFGATVADYRAYLHGRWWATRRRSRLAAAGYACEACGASGDRLEVHHKHYLSLGRERNADLEVLCGPCHRLRHPEKQCSSASE